MTPLEYLENRTYILKLLKKEHSFTVKELSQKFKCSTKTIHRMLDALRAEGHVIIYDRPVKKYVLVNNKGLNNNKYDL
jgi:predicted ArsR family transcriptional regulator